MSATKGQPLPALLFANDLREGDVLFLGAAGWTRDPAEAAIAHTQAEADALQATGDAAAARNEVVDVYLAEVVVDAVLSPLPQPAISATDAAATASFVQFFMTVLSGFRR